MILLAMTAPVSGRIDSDDNDRGITDSEDDDRRINKLRSVCETPRKQNEDQLQSLFNEMAEIHQLVINELKISQLGRIPPGAHIATRRKDGLFDHHGVYMGGGWVIHFQGPWKSPGDPPRCEICGYQPPMNGRVVESCMDCFLRGQSFIILEYKIRIPWEILNENVMSSLIPGKAIYAYKSKKIYLRLYKGRELYGHLKISEKKSKRYEIDHGVYYYECSPARLFDQSMPKAQEHLNDGYDKYDLFVNNCEHFATSCTTDTPRSIQVEKSCFGIGGQFCKPVKWVHRQCQKRKKKNKLFKRLGEQSSNNQAPSDRHLHEASQAIELASASDGIHGCRLVKHSPNEQAPCDRQQDAKNVDERSPPANAVQYGDVRSKRLLLRQKL